METQQQETIGQKIKKWRTERGLTQEGLARKADISYTTFVKIETDVVKNPSVETVKKIAQALEITIDELIS
jgi:XRE family transcriptional regulator of biofilm formation